MSNQDHSSGNIAPHRGVLICMCGILGIGCPLFGIVALILANNDLTGMAEGSVDPAGAGMTRLGRTIACIGLFLFAVFLFYALLWGDGALMTGTGVDGPNDAATSP